MYLEWRELQKFEFCDKYYYSEKTAQLNVSYCEKEKKNWQ